MTQQTQRARDWLDHAKGCRRRAHEHRRWAQEYAPGSPRYERYRAMANRSWRLAWDALANAKIQREIML